MSEETEQQYFKRVDEFIDLANRHSAEHDVARVSSALLYAAARHNAFLVATSAHDREHMEAQKEEALRHNVEQYRQMLQHNLDEYTANFDSYVQEQREKKRSAGE